MDQKKYYTQLLREYYPKKCSKLFKIGKNNELIEIEYGVQGERLNLMGAEITWQMEGKIRSRELKWYFWWRLNRTINKRFKKLAREIK